RHRLRINEAIAVDPDVCDVEAMTPEQRALLEHRLVLNGRRDDVPAASGRRPSYPGDREVVRLGAAAGEDDLARLGTQEHGDALARLVEALAGAAAGVVNARWIAPVLGEIRQHCLERLTPQRRRRGVIEVDAHRRMIAPQAQATVGPMKERSR